MSYLKDFLTQIHQRDARKFFELWEEYCTSDHVEPNELITLLKAIAESDIAKSFGKIIETALPLWQMVEDKEKSAEILRLLVDLQTSPAPLLSKHAFDFLKEKYGSDPKFEQKLRMIGWKNGEPCQGVLSKYQLLEHMKNGNVVFHTGGWGTGEIIETSFVREHLLIEFEKVPGKKDISFANAFKVLIPLPSSHFLARRFTNPDQLEEEGKKNPVALIQLLLKDLGPKTAPEIKDELCGLVINEDHWIKWWQGARTKLKKDSLIHVPETTKESFFLRTTEVSPEQRFIEAINEETNLTKTIQLIYTFLRDFPNALKNSEIKNNLQTKLMTFLESSKTDHNQKIQLLLILEGFFSYEVAENKLEEEIKNIENIASMIENIDIISFKKRVLIATKQFRKDWTPIFLDLLFSLQQSQLKDYILKELNKSDTIPLLKNKLKSLIERPLSSPETFVWYFQKIISRDEEDKDLPFMNKEGECEFFDAFFVLLHGIESRPAYKDLQKKMFNLITANRYSVIRQVLQDTSLEFTKEFLLLSSKCHTFSDHDIKIFRSLAEVVHPSLSDDKASKDVDDNDAIIWTTEEGYQKIHKRIVEIGTIEMVENAKEIESARELGDLRENSEFKFAKERQSRLQNELKTLSQEHQKARIITSDDIELNQIGIGNIVEIRSLNGQTKNSSENSISYTILGPWDADVEKNILSFNSKFAQAMIGKKKGERFQFKDVNYEILDIKSFL